MGPKEGRRLASPATLLILLLLVWVVVLTVTGPTGPVQTNGLGITPSTVLLLNQSGLSLATPQGRALVGEGRALQVARRQGPQDLPQSAFLALASQPQGGTVGSRPRLCWVVLLQAGAGPFGNLPAPGQISLYAVVIDARSGRFLTGVIAFRGPAHSGVGSE
jgi:hypothetical protein